MIENQGFESHKLINSIALFKERLEDSINNFQALKFAMFSNNFDEIMLGMQNEEKFTHFEDYIFKQNKFTLSKEIKESQKETIDAYNNFIDRSLNAKSIEELNDIVSEALKSLRQMSK